MPPKSSQYADNGRVRIDGEGRRILQCHSRGAKEYSPLFCEVFSFGQVRSIEDHYQCTKRFRDRTTGIAQVPRDWRQAKEWQKAGWERVGFFLPNRVFLGNDNSQVTDLVIQYYIALWYRYLRTRPDLVAAAVGYDGYEDIFEAKFPFSQARVMEQAAVHGVESLVPMFHPLRELLQHSA